MAVPVAAPAVDACQHVPPCPPASAPDRDAAVPIARDLVLGMTILCNHVVLFADTGEILPDRSTLEPHRPGVPHCTDESHGHACLCANQET
jgi:hypothetical protein